MKNLGRLAILLTVIAVLSAGVVFTVNNSSTTGVDSRGAFNPGGSQVTGRQDQTGFQPGQQMDGLQPAFQGDFRERDGGGLSAAVEIFKNLGIMLAITASAVIVEKGISLAKQARKVPAAQP